MSNTIHFDKTKLGEELENLIIVEAYKSNDKLQNISINNALDNVHCF